MNRKAEAEVVLLSTSPLALETLIYTKSGRLGQDVTLADICAWSEDEKLSHLDYMKNTIQTSFEFVDYTFRISNVSRAFTHQLVRTRDASFQQEAMRVVDARNSTCTITSDDPIYLGAIEDSFAAYGKLIDQGSAVQNARGVLPTAVHTTIFFKANLRTLSRMSELRFCKRAEGEYQGVWKKLVSLVTKEHSWTSDMLQVACVKTGICAFPNYKGCPVQKYTIKVTAEQKAAIRLAWENSNHVANPVAKDGRTM